MLTEAKELCLIVRHPILVGYLLVLDLMRKFKIRIGTKVGSSAFVGLVLVAGMVWNQARVTRLTQDLISQATLSRNLQQAALEAKARLNELISTPIH